MSASLRRTRRSTPSGKSLSYFTRPSRLDDTAAVHGRAADLLQKRLLEREFDRVRHKSVRAGGGRRR